MSPSGLRFSVQNLDSHTEGDLLCFAVMWMYVTRCGNMDRGGSKFYGNNHRESPVCRGSVHHHRWWWHHFHHFIPRMLWGDD